MIMKCTRKEQFDCVYLTKQNRDEVLKILDPFLDKEVFIFGKKEKAFIEEDNDKYCIVNHSYGNSSYKHYYFYNRWYTSDDESYLWGSSYTDEEFKEEFELVEE